MEDQTSPTNFPGRGPGFGMGRGRGRGRGGGGGGGGGRRGWRHMAQATGLPGWIRGGPGQAPAPGPVEDDEKQYLQSQVAALREQLEQVEHRLSSMSKPEPDEPR